MRNCELRFWEFEILLKRLENWKIESQIKSRVEKNIENQKIENQKIENQEIENHKIENQKIENQKSEVEK